MWQSLLWLQFHLSVLDCLSSALFVCPAVKAYNHIHIYRAGITRCRGASPGWQMGVTLQCRRPTWSKGRKTPTENHGPPGWGLDVGLTTLPRKKDPVTETSPTENHILSSLSLQWPQFRLSVLGSLSLSSRLFLSSALFVSPAGFWWNLMKVLELRLDWLY